MGSKKSRPRNATISWTSPSTASKMLRADRCKPSDRFSESNCQTPQNFRLRVPANTAQLARIWLGSLAPLAPHLESYTLDMAVTRWYDVVDKNETVRLCNCIAANFPKLKRFRLYLHLSRSEINRIISDPNRLCWVLACRLLMARMGINYAFFLTEINESSESFEDWNDMYRTETPWEMFEDQIRQYNTAYWGTQVLHDEHRILHRLTLPENHARK